MKERKDSKKPIITYYLIALAVLLLINVFVVPALNTTYTTSTVSYNQFLSDLNNGKITEVMISESDRVITWQTNEASGGRLTYLRITGGTLSNRQTIRYSAPGQDDERNDIPWQSRSKRPGWRFTTRSPRP